MKRISGYVSAESMVEGMWILEVDFEVKKWV